MAGPYQRSTWRGHRFNQRTVAFLRDLEARLGTTLTIFQGSYNTSVGASAGTHAGGGAADVWSEARTPGQVVRAARNLGAAAWHRRPSQGPWGHHVHLIVLGDREASAAAKDQMVDYRQGRNGLADNGPDYHPRPDPIPMYHYRPGKGPNPVPGKEKPMPDYPTKQDIANTVWDEFIEIYNDDEDKRHTGVVLGQTHLAAREARHAAHGAESEAERAFVAASNAEDRARDAAQLAAEAAREARATRDAVEAQAGSVRPSAAAEPTMANGSITGMSSSEYAKATNSGIAAVAAPAVVWAGTELWNLLADKEWSTNPLVLGISAAAATFVTAFRTTNKPSGGKRKQDA